MQTITHHGCGVIPAFMTSRFGNSGETAAEEARATLEQMREAANARALSLIHLTTPRRSDPGGRRFIYDAQRGLVLPGTLVLSEEQSTACDTEAREAFEALGITADFFHRVFGRKSLDGRGMPLEATVHYGTRFQNVMWIGEQIVYGDGDSRYFNRFTGEVDITAHEYTHALVQIILGIGYSGETGAVNEHFADAIGSLVKQWMLDQTAEEADWLIGASLLKPGVHGRGVRSLAEPGTAYDDEHLGRDPQPSHMDDYVETEEDNGGVHINSGIPNHAFYRVAMRIGGPAWEVAGRIWYETLVAGLPNDPSFLDLAAGTVDMAGELYGRGSDYQRAVAEEWAAVGIEKPLDELLTDPRVSSRPRVPKEMLRYLPR
jgi:Zn-dependent metalloprotease